MILTLMATTTEVNATNPAIPPVLFETGQFSMALNASRGILDAAAHKDFITPPITVECWTLLKSKSDFNLLVANEAKDSGTHWEIYTFSGRSSDVRN